MQNILEENQKFVVKYAPQKIDDMILSENLKAEFKNMLETKQFRNFSLIAGPGVGKTTLAKALAKEANADVLFLGCASGDGKVETIQTKVIPFEQSKPINDKPMFVIFDEIDSASASQDSSFQKALRNVIETYPWVTYIMTANYGQKVIRPLLSRCRPVNLQFQPVDVFTRMKTILDIEKIEYTKSDLKAFVKIAMSFYYPDIRQMLDFLQSCCINGKLQVDASAVSQTAGQNGLIGELVEMILSKENDLLKIREFYLKRKAEIADYAVFASEIFKYILDSKKIGTQPDKDVIIKLADVIYQMNLTVDKEVSFFQFITVLSKLAAA